MGEKILLLVEDNPDDEALALRAVQNTKIPVKVVVCHDGQEGLDSLLQEKNPTPSLVLLDLKMPKVDGLEFLKRVRANETTRGIPVVVFTSSSLEMDVLQSYLLGASGYVRKPVDFESFSEVVRRVMQFWFEVNETPLKRKSLLSSPGKENRRKVSAEA